MEEVDNIELRSEKVRHIIGCIPPVLVHSGIGIIATIIFLLLLAACLIPYPETIQTPVEVVRMTRGGGGKARILLPYARVAKVKLGMRVEMQMEGYDAHTYGYVEGRVTQIHRTVLPGDSFAADIVFRRPERFTIVEKQRGTASICLFEGSIVKRMQRTDIYR